MYRVLVCTLQNTAVCIGITNSIVCVLSSTVMLMLSKKQAMQWMVWFMFSGLLLCALNTFCIFINESCYLMLWGSEIHPNVIWLTEEVFFLFKNRLTFSVQCLPVCITVSFFGILSILWLQADIACLQKYEFLLELLFF